MDVGVTAIVGGITAFITALGAVVLGRRNKSGNSRDIDAESLWGEQRQWRTELRTELGERDARLDKMQERLTLLEGERLSLLGQVSTLQRQILDKDSEITVLHMERNQLKVQLSEAVARIQELEHSVARLSQRQINYEEEQESKAV